MIAIYARVSTEEQAKNGYSLRDQIRECRNIAGNNADIVEYLDEGVSGEFLDRPSLSRLRDDLNSGEIDTVICFDPDRLSRKLMNQLIISEEIEKKARLVFVNGEYKNTPEGILFYQMRGAISEFEKAKINERMCRGRLEKARQGRIVKDYGVYGYDYDRDIGNFAINHYEALNVQKIFDMFVNEQKSISGIAGILTERGVPTKRSAGVWHRQVVRQILANRAYIGEFYQNRWDTRGMLANRYNDSKEKVGIKQRAVQQWILIQCPQIIDNSTFDIAQDILSKSKRRNIDTNLAVYLLGGLLKCGTCGNVLRGRNETSWGRKITVYYHSKGNCKTPEKGCVCRVKAEKLDNVVWEFIRIWLIKRDREDIIDTAQNEMISKTILNSVSTKKRLSEIKKNRSNLVTLLAMEINNMGEETKSVIKTKLLQLENEEKAIKKLCTYADKSTLEEEIREIQYLYDRAACYYLQEYPDQLTLCEKKTILRFLIKEIIVYNKNIEIHLF